MTDLYRTKITLEVFSQKPQEGLTLAEIAARIEDDNTFITGTWLIRALKATSPEVRVVISDVLIAESVHLTPMQMSGALRYADIDRDRLMGDEALEDQPHISIEYDESYSGGNYNKVGDRVYIPKAVFDRFEQDEKKTFEWWTGLNPVHIIHCCPDDLYMVDGQEWESNED